LSSLDHLLLGCSDLDFGVAFVEKGTGVRPAFGGVHRGRGTRNALLSLGDRRYLEVIAPDPQQREVQPWAVRQLPSITTLTTPRLVGWAARCGDIEIVAAKLRQLRIDITGPSMQSRACADGTALKWKMATIVDDRNGVVPFFIEWDARSTHPSVDAPAGCRLDRFAVTAPNTDEIAELFRCLEIDVRVEQGNALGLYASITGPGGRLETRS
jgi:hypothetical protein